MLKRTMQRWRLCVLFAGMVWFPLESHAEPARWNVDPEHSTIEFRVVHMVVSKTTGNFMDYTGFIDMDAEAGVVKVIEAAIKTGSVNTHHEKRDAHLRNVDFFDVEHFPMMTFKMKRYKKTAEGYAAVGDLTLRGVTKEITLVGHYNGATKDPWGKPGPASARRGNSSAKTSAWSGAKR